MISHITPLLLFLSLVFGQAQININNLVERGGKLFKINDDIPYSGLAFSLYDGWEKHIEGTYKDGKQDGLWTYWYDSGQKKGEENYKDGKRDGLWISWYSNGQKKFEDNYKDGGVEGKWIWWDENGQLRIESNNKTGTNMLNKLNAFNNIPKNKTKYYIIDKYVSDPFKKTYNISYLMI